MKHLSLIFVFLPFLFSACSENNEMANSSPSNSNSDPQFEKNVGMGDWRYFNGEDCPDNTSGNCYPIDIVVTPDSYEIVELVGEDPQVVKDYFTSSTWQDEVPEFEGTNILDDLQNGMCIITKESVPEQASDYYHVEYADDSNNESQAVVPIEEAETTE